MLIQPKRAPAPLALQTPEIPGSPDQLLPSGERMINRAAALVNFPSHGLKVKIPIWSAQDEGDKVELLLNGNVVDQRNIHKDDKDQPTTLWVAPHRLKTGA